MKLSLKFSDITSPFFFQPVLKASNQLPKKIIPRYMQEIMAIIIESNADFASNLYARLNVMEKRMINVEQRLKRSDERSVKREDSAEKPGQRVDSTTLPILVFPPIYAPTFK